MMHETIHSFDPPLELVVQRRWAAADRVAALDLRRPDGTTLPPWSAGAHISLRLDGGRLVREYSLCGDPDDHDRWRIAVLLERDGRGGSRLVHDALTTGATVAVERMGNHFRFDLADRPFFIAGGIGITPILPMITAADRAGADWTLLYLGKRRADMPFADDLARWGHRVRIVESSVTGRVDLAALVDAHRDSHFYGCGPSGLIDELGEIARATRATLTVERFVPRETVVPVTELPFEVVVDSTGQRVPVAPDQSTLQALLAAGVVVPNSCGEGTCGSCETVVLDGVPDHRDSILSDEERDAGDCMFVCVSRSRTPTLTLEL